MALGPFVIALPRLFLLLGLAAAWFVAYGVERRSGGSLEKPLWWSLVVGLLVARLGFVLTHLSDYRAQPWEALYFWQGGFMPLLGAMAAILTAGLFVLRGRYRPQRLFPPLLAGLFVWGGLSYVSDALTKATDKPLPDLLVEDLSGQPVNLADFQGKPVVVNLWATWCPPCRREMPVLEAAQQAEPGVEFVFLNQAEAPATIRQYLASEQLQLRNVLLDLGSRMSRDFNAPGLPTTLFFNADGRLVDSHLGEVSRAGLSNYLSKLKQTD